jgi:hypothetical protein
MGLAPNSSGVELEELSTGFKSRAFYTIKILYLANRRAILAVDFKLRLHCGF